MLNIVNNIPNIDLGENLRSFKEFTQDLTPALRGDAIANFEFVQKIHNSFARYFSLISASPHNLARIIEALRRGQCVRRKLICKTGKWTC